jgi:hypothetical protein
VAYAVGQLFSCVDLRPWAKVSGTQTELLIPERDREIERERERERLFTDNKKEE